MREIKFRACSHKDKKCYNPFTLEEAMKWDYIDEIPDDNEHCQYTGLKDKNQKELYYDCDIVELDKQNGIWKATKDRFDIPVFVRCHDSFELVSFGDQFLKIDSNAQGFKIIGNIYEHPNLLTK